MAYTTINKSSLHMNTKLYTGNATARTIDVGFQPDLIWGKLRSTSGNHWLWDSIRGANYYLKSNATDGNNSSTTDLTGFVSNGFTVGTGTRMNTNSQTMASWNWKANGSGSANTVGSINSTVSVNTTSGFSIVKWTGDRSQTQTIGHGLGSIPKIIIIKNLDATQGWTVYSSEIGANERLVLNNTNAKGTCTACFGNTRPTATVFTVGDDADTNGTGNNMIAYCFAEKTGYNKFGSYTGNGNDGDGVFIYTGFKPAFVIIKKSSNAGEWLMLDNKRSTFNVNQSKIFANDNAAENTDTSNGMDFLSNGIKLRRNNGESNEGGQSYIYMAFGQSLVGSNNVPCTAR